MHFLLSVDWLTDDASHKARGVSLSGPFNGFQTLWMYEWRRLFMEIKTYLIAWIRRRRRGSVLSLAIVETCLASSLNVKSTIIVSRILLYLHVIKK